MRARVTEHVKLPAGVRVEYAGQFEREEATGQRLLVFGLLSVLGIALIVGATLGSARRTLIVLVNLPLALAGGVVGVYLAGGVLSVATTIGFITLFGIATRNGILLATRTRDLELAGQAREQAAAVAARERLAPIVMTALTAALGLLAAGARARSAGQRDPGADGARDPDRPAHVDRAQHGRRARTARALGRQHTLNTRSRRKRRA